MLMIEGWLKLAPGEFDKLKDQAEAMVAATNAEDGCLHYSFARDISDPDVIRISERWRDQDALNAHFTSVHMAAFNTAMSRVEREAGELWLYTGEAVRKVM